MFSCFSVDVDFLAALLMAVAGVIAPEERRMAARAYVSEQELQQNGGGYDYNGRYDFTQPHYPQPKPNANHGGNGDYTYVRD
jgi:hypothetical protein